MLVAKKELRRCAGLYTRHDVAEIIGISYHSLRHHIRVGHLAQPQHGITGRPRRYYVMDDVESMRHFFVEGTQ